MALYGMGLLFILLYCSVQFTLLITYLKRKQKSQSAQTTHQEPQDWPSVTVQLPIFNELYVTERLIDAVAAFDYPRESFEIQLLDDSTDETLEITRAKMEEWSAKGVDIKLLHRTDRKGFKAGALQAGLEAAKGEFLAIFDADFLPEPDFLKKMMTEFKVEKIGMVQSGWGHLP